jgi:hypothetical protein
MFKTRYYIPNPSRVVVFREATGPVVHWLDNQNIAVNNFDYIRQLSA